jgi:uncharacterized membrane-anchored protein
MDKRLPQHQIDADAGAGTRASAAVADPTVRAGAVQPAPSLQRAMTKVPEITIFFWITKVLTTAMGEATSDYLNVALGPAIAVPIMLIGLAVALKMQFKAHGYNAWTYWLVVVMVSVFGTSAADALHVGFGIAYPVSTTFYLVVLSAIFLAWYRSEKTLSIHSIYTPRREQFYWATVLATFALGTAAGDMTATSLHMGFLASGVLFATVIAIPAVAYRWFGMNSILAFWFAYIVTRPLGASFADWMDNPPRLGGLALGTGPVALGLTVMIVGFVTYLARTRLDVKDEQFAARPNVSPGLDIGLD